MSMLRELRERRIFQFVSAYVVGSWGLVQFVTFLEGRLLLSPHLVNLLAIGLVTLLPSVVVMAWCHGRPGADRWGRAEKVSIPTNVIAAAVLLFVLFADKDLGAITETVEIRDEHGAVSERVIPKSDYRRRTLIYYFENDGDPADDWLRQGLATALAIDINQDTWVDVEVPAGRAANLRRAGHADGLDLPRPLMRKLARETHLPHFVTGSFARGTGGITLELVLHDTETGRVSSTHELGPAGVYNLVDEASLLVRRELGVPAGHLETQEDLPVADLLTEDLVAYHSLIDGMMFMIHDNDWQAAAAPLTRATELDPGFALAHFLRFAVLMTNGDLDGAHTAMDQAMDNLYRLSERAQFQVKAAYYFNVKQDPERTKAVLDMWTRLYPNDVAAYGQVAAYAQLRRDDAATVAALEKILAIDPTRYEILPMLADHHAERGDFDAAADLLERYAAANPTDVRSFTQLSELYLDFGRLDEARAALEQAQLVEPEHTGTLRELAEIDRRLGRFDEAERSLRTMLEVADNDDDRRAVLGDLVDLHTIQGRWRLARRELDAWDELALVTLNPGQVYMAHAIKLPRATSPAGADSALAELQILRERTGPPNDRMFGMCEAQVLVQLGRLDDAETALAETDAMAGEYQLEVIRPFILLVQGQLAEARGQLTAARDHHARGVALDLTGQRQLRRLGRLQRLTGQYDEAVKTLTGALAHSPGHPEPNLEMALLQEALGRGEDARPYLERTLAAWRDADPDHPGAAAARELENRLGAVQ